MPRERGTQRPARAGHHHRAVRRQFGAGGGGWHPRQAWYQQFVAAHGDLWLAHGQDGGHVDVSVGVDQHDPARVFRLRGTHQPPHCRVREVLTCRRASGDQDETGVLVDEDLPQDGEDLGNRTVGVLGDGAAAGGDGDHDCVARRVVAGFRRRHPGHFVQGVPARFHERAGRDRAQGQCVDGGDRCARRVRESNRDAGARVGGGDPDPQRAQLGAGPVEERQFGPGERQ